MLAFFALSCGDGNNRQSEADDTEENMEGGTLNEENDEMSSDSISTDRDTELHDHEDMESDSTAADGSRRR